jgi:hypothetical protein
MTSDDDDDLIGGTSAVAEPARKRPGRKPGFKMSDEQKAKLKAGRERAKRLREQGKAFDDDQPPDMEEADLPDASEFQRPVSITFLARVLGTETRRIEKKLRHCPVIGRREGRGRPGMLYDFKTALSFLLEPKMDMATWIRSQNPASLPVHINKAFWEAEKSRLAVMERAGQLWHNEDVLDVLGRTALTIKETTQLWVEGMPGKATLTTEQYQYLQRSVTELLDDIHQRLVEMPREARTMSVVNSIQESLAATEQAARVEADGGEE